MLAQRLGEAEDAIGGAESSVRFGRVLALEVDAGGVGVGQLDKRMQM